MSPKAVYAVGKALRGGIPVVFPQFGPGKLPQHGFARNRLWRHGETTVNKATGDVTSSFELTEDAETLAVWPHPFKLTLTVALKVNSLSQQLLIHNTGKDTFEFTTLLHTYFKIDNITTTEVRGLKGLTYLDKPNNAAPTLESEDAVRFRGEVDRVYVEGGSREVRIGDEADAEWLIKTKGFSDFVVWNPAPEKAKGMGDLGEENWDKFICVEAGSVAKPVNLGPGESWEGSQGLSIVMKEGLKK